MFMPGKDLAKVDEYIQKGIQSLEALAAAGDGEAMRQLGYVSLGYYGPEYRAIDLAESWLLKAFATGCFFASNDLFTLYQGSAKAKLGIGMVKRRNMVAELSSTHAMKHNIPLQPTVKKLRFSTVG